MTKLQEIIQQVEQQGTSSGRIIIEYDDGGSLKRGTDGKHSAATRRGRGRGFYLGDYKLPVGYMRVGDMEPLSELLTTLAKVDKI